MRSTTFDIKESFFSRESKRGKYRKGDWERPSA